MNAINGVNPSVLLLKPAEKFVSLFNKSFFLFKY